jgi:hypothetical protein
MQIRLTVACGCGFRLMCTNVEQVAQALDSAHLHAETKHHCVSYHGEFRNPKDWRTEYAPNVDRRSPEHARGKHS